jgi:hypothetical protein
VALSKSAAEIWRNMCSIPSRKRDITLHSVQKHTGVYPASYPVDAVADCSPPSSDDVKNAWSYASTPLGA